MRPLRDAARLNVKAPASITDGRCRFGPLLEEIGYGIVGGITAGLLIGMIMARATRGGLISDAWAQVIPATGGALAYGIAVGLHGSGFVAAFVAGVVFRLALGHDATASAPRRSLVAAAGAADDGLRWSRLRSCSVGIRRHCGVVTCRLRI